MYTALSLLFLVLIIIGTLLTLLLFKFDLRALKESGLDKKIMMWVPFALIFLLILYLGTPARFIIFAIILFMALYEFFKARHGRSRSLFLTFYIIAFVISFCHLGLIRLISGQASLLLLFIIIGTVVSDVTGFFFGSFFGWHKLPEMFNKKKSWEGVLGQLAGALIGVVLVKYYIVHQGSIWIFLPIGLGSALGDLMNSRAKRLAEIKNWSNFIPGHGGFLDRFCSLAGSGFLVFYYILLFSFK
jgi:phosphatidate cytidylyltransferase